MSQYQRLLLITHLALRHSPAMDQAAALGKASGARLHIAALIPALKSLSLHKAGERDKARERYLEDYRDWLKDQAAFLRGAGVEVTTEVAWADDMEQGILDHVVALQPDLLIKEIQHESAFKRTFFTPLDWHLLRHCPIPVYLVGGSHHTLPRTIVAAVDASTGGLQTSELNERIIQQGCSLALQCDAELHLLYAYDTSQHYLEALGESFNLPELSRGLRRELEQSFLTLAGRYGVDTATTSASPTTLAKCSANSCAHCRLHAGRRNALSNAAGLCTSRVIRRSTPLISKKFAT